MEFADGFDQVYAGLEMVVGPRWTPDFIEVAEASDRHAEFGRLDAALSSSLTGGELRVVLASEQSLDVPATVGDVEDQDIVAKGKAVNAHLLAHREAPQARAQIVSRAAQSGKAMRGELPPTKPNPNWSRSSTDPRRIRGETRASSRGCRNSHGACRLGRASYSGLPVGSVL